MPASAWRSLKDAGLGSGLGSFGRRGRRSCVSAIGGREPRLALAAGAAPVRLRRHGRLGRARQRPRSAAAGLRRRRAALSRPTCPLSHAGPQGRRREPGALGPSSITAGRRLRGPGRRPAGQSRRVRSGGSGSRRARERASAKSCPGPPALAVTGLDGRPLALPERHRLGPLLMRHSGMLARVATTSDIWHGPAANPALGCGLRRDWRDIPAGAQLCVRRTTATKGERPWIR